MAVLTFADQALLRQSLLAYHTTFGLFKGLNLEGVGMNSLKIFWLKGKRGRVLECIQLSKQVIDCFKSYKYFTDDLK